MKKDKKNLIFKASVDLCAVSIMVLVVSIIKNANYNSLENKNKIFQEINENLAANTKSIEVRRIIEIDKTLYHKTIIEEDKINKILEIISESTFPSKDFVFSSQLPEYKIEMLDKNEKKIAEYIPPTLYISNKKITILISDYETLKEIID